MKYAIDETLLTTARALGPLLREHAAEAERERRPSRAVVDALNKAGITKMLLPKSLGGLETDPITMLRVVEEIASFDSVAGWLLMVANSGAFTGGRFAAEVAEEIYKDRDDWLVAAAFQPPVAAREVEGGFRVSGQRPLASFAHSARWLLLTALVMDGDAPRMVHGRPVVILTVLPRKDFEVLDTWYGLGLRGTDSTDVAVHDAFVPAAFTSPLVPGGEPNRHYRSALYRMPMLATTVLASISPVALAIAQSAVDAVRDLSAKRVPMASAVPLRERGVAQARLGRAEAMLRSARAYAYETMADAWTRAQAGDTFDLEARANVLLAAAHAAQTGAEVTDAMFASAGSSGIYAGRPLERLFRDAQVVRQHGFVAPSRYESGAQVLLGLDCDLPLIHF